MRRMTLGTGLFLFAGAISLIAAALPAFMGRPVRLVNVMFLGSGIFWVTLALATVAKAPKSPGSAA